jgi:hypothetical protein
MIEALNDAMTRELVLVCTPAGFGKTTLLADLGQHRGELAGCRSTPTTTIRRASGSTSSQPRSGLREPQRSTAATTERSGRVATEQ